MSMQNVESIGSRLADNAHNFRDQDALVFPGLCRLSWGELNEAVDRVAGDEDSGPGVEQRDAAGRVSRGADHTHPEHLVAVVQFRERKCRPDRADVCGPGVHGRAGQLGLEVAEAPTSRKDLALIQMQLNDWQRETGLPYTHLSRILALSTGPNRSAEELRHYMGGDGE